MDFYHTSERNDRCQPAFPSEPRTSPRALRSTEIQTCGCGQKQALCRAYRGSASMKYGTALWELSKQVLCGRMDAHRVKYTPCSVKAPWVPKPCGALTLLFHRRIKSEILFISGQRAVVGPCNTIL
jgi:hypothetical protein